jgi:hypothetical protein
MFHSSATSRRREQTLPEAPGPRQAPHPREDTAGSASSQARTTESALARRTPIASQARTRDPNRPDHSGCPAPSRGGTVADFRWSGCAGCATESARPRPCGSFPAHCQGSRPAEGSPPAASARPPDHESDRDYQHRTESVVPRSRGMNGGGRDGWRGQGRPAIRRYGHGFPESLRARNQRQRASGDVHVSNHSLHPYRGDRGLYTGILFSPLIFRVPCKS